MGGLRSGYGTGVLLGVLWTFVVATTVAVAWSFATGDAYRPSLIWSAAAGAGLGLAGLRWRRGGSRVAIWGAMALVVVAGLVAGWSPVAVGDSATATGRVSALISAALGSGIGLWVILRDCAPGALSRHHFEAALIRFLTGFGYIFFTAIVLIPFYVMVMTSLKSQQALLQNPLDFSLDLSRGWDLLRSYRELLTDYNFGRYLWTSFWVSVATVAITLAFSIPGAYAVARLRFRGRALFSRSILLIYMVPMIVLALPIYIGFSMVGLRNSLFGIVLIYPVTTIPVALYMLQG